MFIHESGSPGSPAIVFLHGNGANGTMWKTHMEQLADFHCLAPDFPGFGQSGDVDTDAQRCLLRRPMNGPRMAVRSSRFVHYRMVRAWLRDEELPGALVKVV